MQTNQPIYFINLILEIAEKPNVNTLNSVAAGLIGGMVFILTYHTSH